MDTGIILPFVVAFIMFGVGLSLTLKDFRLIFIKPVVILAGLFCQMILLPGLAFAIVSLFDIAPEYKVGIVIISACPGGATSNLITHLLRGNVALSISLTAFNSLLTLLSIPFITGLALHVFFSDGAGISLPLGETILKIFLMTVLPVMTGLFVRHKWTHIAEWLDKPLRYVMTISLATIYIVIAFEDGEGGSSGMNLFSQLHIFPYVFALNVLGMTAGVVVARLLRYNKKVQITYAIEVGIQNSALAITIGGGTAFLNNSMIAMPALIYALFTFFSAVLFGLVVKRWL